MTIMGRCRCPLESKKSPFSSAHFGFLNMFLLTTALLQLISKIVNHEVIVDFYMETWHAEILLAGMLQFAVIDAHKRSINAIIVPTQSNSQNRLCSLSNPLGGYQMRFGKAFQTVSWQLLNTEEQRYRKTLRVVAQSPSTNRTVTCSGWVWLRPVEGAWNSFNQVPWLYVILNTACHRKFHPCHSHWGIIKHDLWEGCGSAPALWPALYPQCFIASLLYEDLRAQWECEPHFPSPWDSGYCKPFELRIPID